MKFVRRLLSGIAIGIGAAIPGVSGAAIALICRIYDELIDAINSLSKHFLNSLRVLLPIALGIIIALVPCIYLFSLAFEHLMFVLICLFVGFLVGSLPSVGKEIKGEQIKSSHKLLFIISIIFVVLIGILSAFLGPNINLSYHFSVMPIWLYFVLIPVGILAAVALTVPGLSGSLILLVIGFYRPLVDYTRLWAGEIFKYHDFANTGKLLGMLGCFAIGCVIGVVVVSKIMRYLLNKHKVATYCVIIGFIIGSIIALFFNEQTYAYYQYWAGITVEGKVINPILKPYIEIPLGIIALVFACFASYWVIKKSDKTKENGK